MKTIYRNSVAGFEGKRVTKWSLFWDEAANGFEGVGMLNWLRDGWCAVWGAKR